MSCLIKNVWYDDAIVDILIEKNRFTQIGKNLKAKADEVVDATGKMILPAFYNTHNHAAMIAFRGLGEGKELFAWLSEDIWPREAKLNEEIVYAASKMAILEMIKTGTVFFSDMYFNTNATMQAVEEMGVRAAISFTQFDMFDEKETAVRKEKSREFMEKPSNCERLQKGISCHGVYTVSEELIAYSVTLAKKHNTYLHIHASETKQEVDDCLAKYGMTPIAKLHELGALSPKTILAHCVWATDEDIAIIKKTGAVVAHCPGSNLKLNSGQMPLQKMLDCDCRISLGTDGACSNNSLSMLNEMRICTLSAKNQMNSVTAGSVKDVWAMASGNGAEAFGLDAGEIAVGKLADFILVDMNHYSMLPLHDYMANWVFSANPECIVDVFCNGQAVMRDHKVDGEAEIIENFKKMLQNI